MRRAGLCGAGGVLLVLLAADRAIAQSAGNAPGWTLRVGADASVSDGTQRQVSVEPSLVASLELGRLPSSLHAFTQFDGMAAYGTATKPGQAAIRSSELLSADLRQSVDLVQALSLLRGGVAARSGAASQAWLYGVANAYHNIAFGLRSQQGYGAGVTTAVPRVAGLTVGADLRHVTRVFDTADRLSSWATAVRQSYGRRWPASGDARLVFAESVEVQLPFESPRAAWVRTTFMATVPATAGFSLTLTVGTDHVGVVPPAYENTYWKSKAGVVYELSR
jgi:hypothetical protein